MHLPQEKPTQASAAPSWDAWVVVNGLMDTRLKALLTRGIVSIPQSGTSWWPQMQSVLQRDRLLDVVATEVKCKEYTTVLEAVKNQKWKADWKAKLKVLEHAHNGRLAGLLDHSKRHFVDLVVLEDQKSLWKSLIFGNEDHDKSRGLRRDIQTKL